MTRHKILHPRRRTLRTVFQALIGLAAAWGVVVQVLGLPDWAWVSVSLAVTAGVTRAMATPQVEALLSRFLPWLAAQPPADGPDASE